MQPRVDREVVTTLGFTIFQTPCVLLDHAFCEFQSDKSSPISFNPDKARQNVGPDLDQN